MNTNETTITTWRAYADQLTTDEVQRLADLAARLAGAPADALAQLLVDQARRFIEDRRVGAKLAHVAAPACHRVGVWEPDGAGGHTRGLVWSEHSVGHTSVTVEGSQDSDGTVTRDLMLFAGEGDARLSAGEARQLARLLIAAAEEVERVS